MNCTMFTPSRSNTPQDCRSFKSHLSTPLANSQSLPIGSKIVRCSSIVRLCSGGRPFHITLFVMPVIIYTIKRMLRSWPSPNAIQELRKGIKTKLNSTSSIIVKSLITRIIAPTLCHYVRIIFTRNFIPRSYFCTFAVTCKLTSRKFRLPASTTLRTSSCKIVYPNSLNGGTFALTDPLMYSTFFPSISQYRPTVKNTSGQIFKLRISGMWLKRNVKIWKGHIDSYQVNLARLADSFVRICEPFYYSTN